MKTCITCLQSFGLNNFYKMGKYYSSRCKPCFKEQRKSRYRANPEKDLIQSKNWKINNRERSNRTTREWRREKYQRDPKFRDTLRARNEKRHKVRYKEDPVYRTRVNSRAEMKQILKGKYSNNYISKHGGFSRIQLVERLESLFRDGMSWENYNIDWEIDHIIPISKGKTIEEVMELSKLSNLQPLFKHENRKKRDNANYNTTTST